MNFRDQITFRNYDRDRLIMDSIASKLTSEENALRNRIINAIVDTHQPYSPSEGEKEMVETLQKKNALAIAEDLRTDGFSVLADWSGAGPAEGLSRAEAAGARFYAVVDAASVSEGKLAVRSLEDGRTSRVELGDGLTRFFYDQELSELSGVLEGFPFQDGAEE